MASAAITRSSSACSSRFGPRSWMGRSKDRRRYTPCGEGFNGVLVSLRTDQRSPCRMARRMHAPAGHRAGTAKR
jgi:hypothetical protein